MVRLPLNTLFKNTIFLRVSLTQEGYWQLEVFGIKVPYVAWSRQWRPAWKVTMNIYKKARAHRVPFRKKNTSIIYIYICRYISASRNICNRYGQYICICIHIDRFIFYIDIYIYIYTYTVRIKSEISPFLDHKLGIIFDLPLLSSVFCLLVSP